MVVVVGVLTDLDMGLDNRNLRVHIGPCRGGEEMTTTKVSTKRYELWKREDVTQPGEYGFMIWDTEKGGAFNWYYTGMDARTEFEALLNYTENGNAYLPKSNTDELVSASEFLPSGPSTPGF